MKRFISALLFSVLILSSIPVNALNYENDTISSFNSIEENQNIEDVVNNLTLEKMTEKQKEIFYDAVEEEVKNQDFKDSEEEELFKEELIALFSEETQDEVLTRGILPEHMGIGKKVMGAGLNVAISAAVGGVGYGSVSAYIKSVGKREAEKLFSKTIKSRLIAWGATKFAVSLGAMVEWVLNYSDFGNRISDAWDANDAVPNNGWCDFY